MDDGREVWEVGVGWEGEKGIGGSGDQEADIRMAGCQEYVALGPTACYVVLCMMGIAI